MSVSCIVFHAVNKYCAHANATKHDKTMCLSYVCLFASAQSFVDLELPRCLVRVHRAWVIRSIINNATIINSII